MTATLEAPTEDAVRCVRCHRKLRDPLSVRRGVGPDCWAQGAALLTAMTETDMMDLPYDEMTGDIVCARDPENDFRRHFNTPMYDFTTKQSGFEWGYGGTGPASYALNILIHYGLSVRECTLSGMYHDFKRRFVETLPREGGTIRGDDIRAWIAQHYPVPQPHYIVPIFIFNEEEGAWKENTEGIRQAVPLPSYLGRNARRVAPSPDARAAASS